MPYGYKGRRSKYSRSFKRRRTSRYGKKRRGYWGRTKRRWNVYKRYKRKRTKRTAKKYHFSVAEAKLYQHGFSAAQCNEYPMYTTDAGYYIIGNGIPQGDGHASRDGASIYMTSFRMTGEFFPRVFEAGSENVAPAPWFVGGVQQQHTSALTNYIAYQAGNIIRDNVNPPQYWNMNYCWLRLQLFHVKNPCEIITGANVKTYCNISEFFTAPPNVNYGVPLYPWHRDNFFSSPITQWARRTPKGQNMRLVKQKTYWCRPGQMSVRMVSDMVVNDNFDTAYVTPNLTTASGLTNMGSGPVSNGVGKFNFTYRFRKPHRKNYQVGDNTGNYHTGNFFVLIATTNWHDQEIFPAPLYHQYCALTSVIKYRFKDN